MKKIEPWIRDEEVEFSDVVGDHTEPPSSRTPWLKKKTDIIFCTLDASSSNPTAHIDNLTKLRFHAYECRSINWFSVFGGQTRSKRCEGRLCGIGFSTAVDANTRPTEQGGVHRIAGKVAHNPRFWSQPIADLTRTKASKVKIEYIPGSGCITSLIVLGPTGQELTSWKAYGQAKVDVPKDVKVVEQEAPDSRGWLLAGFWGHVDSRVITRVGAIWKKA